MNFNRGDPNVRMPNQIMLSRPRLAAPNNNPRFVHIGNQGNFAPMQNAPTNVPVLQSQPMSNQNSITNKLCKFFMNLLELEKDQGRYDESLAIIQRYINKEINVDELGNQLKGNASRTALPESLITSLKSNIDDLRREMFYGRVRIDRINPPPESVIEMAPSSVPNNVVTSIAPNSNPNPPRMTTPQLITQRPTMYSQPINVVPRQTQPQVMANSQIVRQPLQQNTRQTRPIGNTMAAFAPQTTLSVSNANLRSIAPSSPIRQPVQGVPNSGIRTMSVSTSALTNVKPSAPVKIEEYKSEVIATVIETPRPVIEPHHNNVTLPTNIVNHTNYRNKISEVFKCDTGNVNISEEALNYVSEAIENFSISLLEQAAAFACHRQEMFINDPMYKKIDDVRSQMKYLQDYEDYQRASEEERQKAELFKVAKSRSKTDNHEQQKIKETVRKIQEHDKNCDEYSRANMTALKAIGSKRKIFDGEDGLGSLQVGNKTGRTMVGRPGGMEYGGGGAGGAGPGSQIYINTNYVTANTGGGPLATANKQARIVPALTRQRNKRIILKDFQLVLDQDVKLKRFKTFKKIFMFGRY